MIATKTWAYFYAKDYGGGAVVQARIYVRAGAGERLARTLTLAVPKDTDGDALTDKWEIAMAERWRLQYGLPAFTDAQALAKFNTRVNPFTGTRQDDELRDPDGTQVVMGVEQRPLVPQKETGDAHTVLEEYRGYILDGGGLDGAGANRHPGGHIRLDPARKEVLVEVDHASVLNNVPGMGTIKDRLTAILDGASKVFSNADRGAGIYLYYLFDQTQLDIPKAAVNTEAKILAKLAETRNQQLKSDFLHFLLFDQGLRDAYPPSGHAGSAGRGTTDVLEQRGSELATTDVHVVFPQATYPKRDELFMTIIAHEITHQLFDKVGGAFDENEHTDNANGTGPPDEPEDKKCLMYHAGTVQNRELATVKFFPVVQAELSTRTSEGLVL